MSALSATEAARKLSLGEISDLLEYLYCACEITIDTSDLKKHRSLLLSPFSTGFTFGPCGLHGRMAALKENLKRAFLLSSHVLVSNPFAYSRAEPFTADTDIARMNLAGLLRHVHDSLPLLEDGLMGFYPNAFSVCSEHKALIDSEETRIHEALLEAKEQIVDELLRGVSATLLVDEQGYYFYRFSGEHPIMNPEGKMDLIFGEGALPEDLKAAVGQTVSREALLRAGSVIPILDRIEHLAYLFSLSAHFCKLDLMALDATEIRALEAANLLSGGLADRTFALSDLSMPDLGLLSVKRLQRVMHREKESLERLRKALGDLIREINDSTLLSSEERSQLIAERLGRERDRLSAQLTAHRKHSLRRAMAAVIAGGLSLGLGLFSGSVGSAAAAFEAVGGISILTGVGSGIASAVRVPDNLKADSWYFLWRQSRKGR